MADWVPAFGTSLYDAYGRVIPRINEAHLRMDGM